MRSFYFGSVLSRLSRTTLALLLLSMFVVLSACGDTSAQQQAGQNKAQLDSLVQQAQRIGVPASLISSIRGQEQELSNAPAPFTLFNNQASINYDRDLATRYAQLRVQVQGIISTTTDTFRAQAQKDMQTFQLALNQRRAQGLPVANFTRQYSQDQSMLARARYPKDYAAISSAAVTATQSLNLMQSTANQLAILKHTINQMKSAHLDVTVIQAQYQSDQQELANAVKPSDFQQLAAMIDAHYQQAVVSTVLVIPYVTAAKMSEFQQQLNQLKLYGVDSGPYQKRFDADRAMMARTTNLQSYAAFSKQIDADISAMQYALLQGQASSLIKQFHNEVASWGNAHQYHDSYNGNNYPLDAGYMSQGIGEDLDNALAAAATPQDLQAVIDEANGALFNLHMMEANYNDHTPYDQMHATDLQLLNHYGLQKGQVLMVSLTEQALRLYQNGNLVRSFLVTTGRFELPALPGVWSVLARQSPTIFKSPDPPGSPYWYPDTPIHYAIMYHAGGYYVHDSWWRADYGPGTQFPHYDSGGDESFAGDGSHGCINMQEDQAAWVYNNTDWNTMIVVY